MYSIKDKPKDFIVDEIINLNLDGGGYIYFKLKKENFTTIKALELIAMRLNLKLKNFGFAGNKDKKAITTQACSVFGANEDKLKDLKLSNIKIEILGRGKSPISLGDLEGNSFKIFVKAEKIKKTDFFVNYYGEQRFGINCNNHIIGKYLLERRFKQACNNLNLSKINPINSLREFGARKLKFFLHSYQSYLWNSLIYEKLKEKNGFEVPYCLGKYKFLDKKIKNFKVNLPNFDTDDYNHILKKENLVKEAFLIRELPELVSETSFRDVIREVKGLKVKRGKEGYFLSFFLNKGSYATVFLKKLFF